MGYGSFLTRGIYGGLAKVSAWSLGLSGEFESVYVHRSVATGELVFGRSDIDLMGIVKPEAAVGARLYRLYLICRLLRLFNPALQHLELYLPDGPGSLARSDSCWAELERRSRRCLYGKDTPLPEVKWNPEHGLRRFLVWVELYFTMLLQRGEPRNVRKLSLECWNFFACAQGFLSAPLVLRSSMAEELEKRRCPDLERLHQVPVASRFILGLAAELHACRRPPLKPLERPIHFRAVVPPFCLAREVIVIPRADWPLPVEFQRSGALLFTPELLDLYLTYRNGFLSWVLPDSVWALGVTPPEPEVFLRECRYYAAHRFLFHPGFARRWVPHPGSRLKVLEHAVPPLLEGRLPEPMGQTELAEQAGMCHSLRDYYFDAYPDLARRTQALLGALETIPDG